MPTKTALLNQNLLLLHQQKHLQSRKVQFPRKLLQLQAFHLKSWPRIVNGADPKVIEAHKSVNAQLLLRGVQKQIKKLGSKPIALIAEEFCQERNSFETRSCSEYQRSGVLEKKSPKLSIGKSNKLLVPNQAKSRQEPNKLLQKSL